ncbi:MAG: hypothetical protein A2138_18435 [Deltaproteobacteria bacterium RBG_16_71_12]|nr:MAG: hypothetical protein A2138_18435 [Deltaproteobacteria bacterium RBG_16_71_12]
MHKILPLLSLVVPLLPRDARAEEKPPAPPPLLFPAPAPLWRVTGLATPEGVVYDEANDRYLVSNINGKPLDRDNNGFIAVLSPDGKLVTEKWIAGGQRGVTLNAPKGMAIDQGVLFVSDIDVVHTFDLKTGANKGDIEIKGASFLNDVAADSAAHKVYVSDSGMKQGAKDFEPTGSDGVWVIEGKKAAAFFLAKDLGRPNGLWVQGKDLYVNFFGSADIAKLDAKNGKTAITTAPGGGGDGLYVGADGTVWSSSWGAGAIFKGKLGGTFVPAVQHVAAPADFAVDTKRKRLVVPRFMDDAVEIYEMKE